MIKRNIKILVLEDNVSDIFLIKREIKKILDKPIIEIVSDLQAFIGALENFTPDIILCDYQLNGFTGLDALQQLNQSQKITLGIPFVFVTGTVNDEELAANTILSGATGYVLKKDMNRLHEKLLPHFEELIANKEFKKNLNLDLDYNSTGNNSKGNQDILNYIKKLQLENQKIISSNAEISEELEQTKRALNIRNS